LLHFSFSFKWFPLTDHLIWYNKFSSFIKYPVELRVDNERILVQVFLSHFVILRLRILSAVHYERFYVNITHKCRKVQMPIGTDLHFLRKQLHFASQNIYFWFKQFYLVCKPEKWVVFIQPLCIKVNVYSCIIVKPKFVRRRDAQASSADGGRESGGSPGVGTAIRGGASGWTGVLSLATEEVGVPPLALRK
jgi:hypothetical protein